MTATEPVDTLRPVDKLAELAARIRAMKTKVADSDRRELDAIAAELLSVRQALIRHTPGVAQPPREPSNKMAELARQGWETSARGKHKNPAPGMRRCTKCKQTLAVNAFDVKDKQRGWLKSWCHACTLQYQRERYVHVGQKVVTIEVLEGDGCVGHACSLCHHPFAVGDHIQSGILCHDHCPEGIL